MIMCGTGHRPDKLGGYSEAAYEHLLGFAVDTLLRYEPTKIISGMALGWDTALAEAALLLEIPCDGYIPFVGQESRWPKSSQDEYRSILRNIGERNLTICSDGPYAVWKMQERNERMVQSSAAVIALWDGSAGGTANCVAYANKVGTEVINVWDEWSEHCRDW